MTSKGTCRRFAGLVGAMILAAAAGVPGPAAAATAELIDRSALRVCADPSNPPFSTKTGGGFENKIAELFAAELKVPVRYTWYPDSLGFVRNTLAAHRCDLIMGVATASEFLQNTNPYYHSTYTLVYRKGTLPAVTSLDNPVLKTLKIGAVAQTPPVTLLAQKGLLDNLHPYRFRVDTRVEDPARDLIHDVATGTLDIGLVWGPIAGYYAKQEATPLAVVPLQSENGVRMDFLITMGVRHNEQDWKHQINRLIREKQPEINRILFDYGVPLLDRTGKPIREP